MALDDTKKEKLRDPEWWPNKRIIGTFLDSKRSTEISKTDDNSYQAYQTRMRRFHAWLEENDFHITEMSPVKTEKFVEKMVEEGYQPNTCRDTLTTVSELYNRLEDKYGVVQYDEQPHPTSVSMKEIDGVSETTMSEQEDGIKRYHISEKDKDDMLDHVPIPKIRNRLIIEMLYQTGFRRSTLTNIETEDGLDRDAQTVTAYSPKADKEVRAVYTDRVADWLSVYLDLGKRRGFVSAEDTDKLFIGDKGPLTANWVNEIVKEAAENAGIQKDIGMTNGGNTRKAITAHTLRHSHAVHMLDSGKPLNEVQESLNHTDIEVTQIYTEMGEDEFIRRQREDNAFGDVSGRT